MPTAAKVFWAVLYRYSAESGKRITEHKIHIPIFEGVRVRTEGWGESERECLEIVPSLNPDARRQVVKKLTRQSEKSGSPIRDKKLKKNINMHKF